jgi:hypothetical protein
MSKHLYEKREFVAYSPELDELFVTQATFILDVGVYYKMFCDKYGEFIVVVNLGAL